MSGLTMEHSRRTSLWYSVKTKTLYVSIKFLLIYLIIYYSLIVIISIGNSSICRAHPRCKNLSNSPVT